MQQSQSLPQDIIVYHLFPKLPISRVIEITQLDPVLLPKTKEHILKLGNSIGIVDSKDAKDVLAKLENKKDPKEVFDRFQSYFIDDIVDFLITWVDEDVYHQLDNDNILKILQDIFDDLYGAFEHDWNANLDYVFGKTLIKPEVYLSKKQGDLFSKWFPNLYREFYQKIEYFFLNTKFCENFDSSTFRDQTTGDIHHIIKANTQYNGNKFLCNMLFD